MPDRTYKVLFLCTGNSARSILAESLLNGLGNGRFKAYSAGSHPKGTVNPFAVEALRKSGMPTEALSSKSWSEYDEPKAPVMDFIFTVCDNAAGEACPVWPGHPMTAHWGVEDPAAVEGANADKRRAFAVAMHQLRNRIQMFVSLPLETLDQLALQKQLAEIGKSAP